MFGNIITVRADVFVELMFMSSLLCYRLLSVNDCLSANSVVLLDTLFIDLRTTNKQTCLLAASLT